MNKCRVHARYMNRAAVATRGDRPRLRTGRLAAGGHAAAAAASGSAGKLYADWLWTEGGRAASPGAAAAEHQITNVNERNVP